MSKLLSEAALARHVRNVDLAQLDAWLVVIADDLDDAAWRRLPRGEWLRAECGRRKLRNGSVITARLDTAAQTLLIAGMRKRHASVFETLQLAGRMLKEAKSTQARRLGVSTLGLPGAAAGEGLEAVVAATYAAGFDMPSFKSKHQAADSLVELKLFSPRANGNLMVTRATSEDNNLARWLTALPGNALTAASYRRRVSELARREGWRMRFLDSRTLKRRGAGAFLAVAQGNATDDAGIIHLRYRPRGRKTGQKLLALIGKGVCFDTGGTNLKPHRGMLDMHTDMEGSAVALGTLLALTRLTGACVNALTERYTGLFTNRPRWHTMLERAGTESGERVWRIPMDQDFDTDLESPIADLMQCAPDGKGDHILAARFLNRFVPAEIPWVHLDLAAGQRTGGLGHITTDITGFGVRYAINLLTAQKILQRAASGKQ